MFKILSFYRKITHYTSYNINYTYFHTLTTHNKCATVARVRRIIQLSFCENQHCRCPRYYKSQACYYRNVHKLPARKGEFLFLHRTTYLKKSINSQFKNNLVMVQTTKVQSQNHVCLLQTIWCTSPEVLWSSQWSRSLYVQGTHQAAIAT